MTARACQHHPEEAAVGICIRCSAALCVACITKVDGINHCQSCLLARAQAPLAQALRDGPENARTGWLALALGVLLLSGLAWTTLNAVLPVGTP